MSIDYKVTLAFLITLLICSCQRTKNNPLSKPQCKFDNFIGNPKIPQFAKDIYLGNDFNLDDDDKALALLDSLDSGNKDMRKFYFKVVLNSSKKADGYYSEGLGEAVLDYTESNTKEFASYFDDKECFDDKDLETVSGLLLSEFEILSENEYDKSIIEDYLRSLKDNCLECSITQKATIEKLTGLMIKK